ncbi:hypothetical protein Sango_0083100 [Sesamum angolense]|uniref:Uncharacterized protein n=1 Tax=Sesamum angolense TaxID=2727404 RepID=A0AAE1XER5_9LAMI|nr:hypothetical protein Sango_0083100 [Sesamum angolense]
MRGYERDEYENWDEYEEDGDEQEEEEDGENGYGSFFGPSQPVIAQRVIQESKSLLENPDLAARISRPNHTLKRPTPKLPARGNLAEERPKAKPKRPRHDDDSDGENAINMIRQMFGYNPNRFRDDDDVSDMEANFDDIMRGGETQNHVFYFVIWTIAKIAKREDEEQLRLIEEEERRERMRLAKKRKLGRQ